MAFKDLTGMKFGRLLVLGIAYIKQRKSGGTVIYWRCKCECGKEIVVVGTSLRRGRTQSCGCLKLEKSTTHGLRHSKYYGTWCNIKNRCYNPNADRYERYGGRGITMYEGWINDFPAFLAYISTLEHFGEAGYTLDREDNNGNYEPGNLRFATPAEQARNRRNNRIVEYNGVEMTLPEAAELSGINYKTLNTRYHRGKRGDELFKPVQK